MILQASYVIMSLYHLYLRVMSIYGVSLYTNSINHTPFWWISSSQYNLYLSPSPYLVRSYSSENLYSKQFFHDSFSYNLWWVFLVFNPGRISKLFTCRKFCTTSGPKLLPSLGLSDQPGDWLSNMTQKKWLIYPAQKKNVIFSLWLCEKYYQWLSNCPTVLMTY